MTKWKKNLKTARFAERKIEEASLEDKTNNDTAGAMVISEHLAVTCMHLPREQAPACGLPHIQLEQLRDAAGATTACTACTPNDASRV
jgi:hypothetical protein